METLKYTAVRKVKDLNRAHPTDAGIDFYIPEDLTVADFAPKCQTTGDDLMITLNEHASNVLLVHILTNIINTTTKK